jgi:phage terminase small subunit
MSDNTELTAREQMFCHYLVETNNRTTAIVKSGYCPSIVKRAKGRDFTHKEKNTIYRQAFKLLSNPKLKDYVSMLVEARLNYLNENGVYTDLEVLKKLTDIVKLNHKNNIFMIQQVISASREILNYYKDKNKLLVNNKENTQEVAKEAKTFIVEYTEKKEGDDDSSKVK